MAHKYIPNALSFEYTKSGAKSWKVGGNRVSAQEASKHEGYEQIVQAEKSYNGTNNKNVIWEYIEYGETVVVNDKDTSPVSKKKGKKSSPKRHEKEKEEAKPKRLSPTQRGRQRRVIERFEEEKPSPKHEKEKEEDAKPKRGRAIERAEKEKKEKEKEDKKENDYLMKKIFTGGRFYAKRKNEKEDHYHMRLREEINEGSFDAILRAAGTTNVNYYPSKREMYVYTGKGAKKKSPKKKKSSSPKRHEKEKEEDVKPKEKNKRFYLLAYEGERHEDSIVIGLFDLEGLGKYMKKRVREDGNGVLKVFFLKVNEDWSKKHPTDDCDWYFENSIYNGGDERGIKEIDDMIKKLSKEH
jgi:hypothetical protein